MNSIRSCRSGADRAQLQLAAAADHIVEHRVERELVFAGPLRDDLPDLGAVAAEERGRRRRAAMPRIVGEDAQQIAVVDRRMVDRVVRALLRVVLGQRLGELAQRIDAQPAREQRLLAGDLGHQLVDIFELLQRRPALVALAPVRARREPDREGLGEILVRMALRVPERQMLDVAPAAGVRPVVVRVAGRGAAEQLAASGDGDAADRRPASRARPRGAGCACTPARSRLRRR